MRKHETSKTYAYIRLEGTFLCRARRKQRQHSASGVGSVHVEIVEKLTSKRSEDATHPVFTGHVTTIPRSCSGVTEYLVRVRIHGNVAIVPKQHIAGHVVEMLLLLVVAHAIHVPWVCGSE